MTIIMSVGKNPDGIFYIDIENKKVLKVEIKNENLLRMNFPKVLTGYTYSELEQLMQFYTKDEMDLEEILQDIQKNGFFYSLKPSLNIKIQTEMESEIDVE